MSNVYLMKKRTWIFFLILLVRFYNDYLLMVSLIVQNFQPFCTLFLQILLTANELNPVELDFLLRFPIVPNLTTPVDFLSNNSWGGIKVKKISAYIIFG